MSKSAQRAANSQIRDIFHRIRNRRAPISTLYNRWDEKAGLRRDAISSQVIGALEAQKIRRPAMKKLNTMPIRRASKLQEEQLTVGLDLGDRSSFYCVLNGAG